MEEKEFKGDRLLFLVQDMARQTQHSGGGMNTAGGFTRFTGIIKNEKQSRFENLALWPGKEFSLQGCSHWAG